MIAPTPNPYDPSSWRKAPKKRAPGRLSTWFVRGVLAWVAIGSGYVAARFWLDGEIIGFCIAGLFGVGFAHRLLWWRPGADSTAGAVRKKLAQEVRNQWTGETYSVSTVRMWPLTVWETAVFRGGPLSAVGWKNCVYVEETYEPRSMKGLYAKGQLEQIATSTHDRICQMVAREPVDGWRMDWEVIQVHKNAAAQNS